MASGSGYFKTSYRQEFALYDTAFRRFWLVVLLGGVLLAPMIATPTQLNLLNLMSIAVIGALALNLLTGYAGQVSLGHAGFLALGAYTAGALVKEWEAPFLLVLAVAAVVSGLVGVLTGIPALRLRGLYLALGTLAFHFLVVYAISEYQSRQLGSVGLLMPDPVLWLFTIDTNVKWYYFLVTVAGLTLVACTNLVRTRTGRAWIAVRDRDIVAEAFGVNVAGYKLRAFVVSSALTGLSGALWAYYLHFVSVEAFTLTLAIQYIAMIVIGGLGSILGAVLGAAFITLLPEAVTVLYQGIVSSASAQQNLIAAQSLVFGLLILLFLLLEPTGLVGIWLRMRQFFELWPLKHRPLMQSGKH